jgi:hypothetical protein
LIHSGALFEALVTACPALVDAPVIECSVDFVLVQTFYIKD